MLNPYVRAAVRKQQADRALRLPPAQAEDFPAGAAVAEFMDGAGAGGPRAGMIRNIRCGEAARRMTDGQLAALAAWYARGRQLEHDRLAALDAPACLLANALRPAPPEAVLARELKRRGR